MKKRNVILYGLLYALVLCPLPVRGEEQETTVLSLDDCRQRAVEQNVRMRNAALTADAAEETSRQAFTQYFPELSASGMAYNANKGLLEMDMGPDLGTMSLLKNGVLGGLTLTQPVLAGGQIVNGNRLAKVGVEVAELQASQTENEVRLTVEQYYWQVVTLTEQKRTLQTVHEMLNSLYTDVETSVKAGLTTRNDLLQVQLRRNDIESSMLSLDNGLSLSKMILAQYVGLSGTPIEVSVDEPIDSIPTFPTDLRVDHNEALLQTPEYQLLERNVKARTLERKMAVGKNLPTVGVGVGYMYDNLMDKDHPFGVAFVSGSVPLSGWWGGSHDIRRRKAEENIAKGDLTDNAELLVIRMQHLWDEVSDAYRQILIAHNSIEQSAENLRLNQDYYRAGMSTMSDLLDAQMLYQQSRDKLVDTYSKFQLKKLEYRQATAQE
jgi:outer membrane protein TolC